MCSQVSTTRRQFLLTGRTKRNSAWTKWGGLLPISNVGLRHCRGVAIGRAWRARQCACAHDQGLARASERACLEGPIATGFLVATEDSLSRQRRLALYWTETLVSRQGAGQ